MVIEKVHGLQATNLTLNDRFTILAKVVPERVAPRPRRRSVGSLLNYNNRGLIEQIARRLEQQSKRVAMRQRLGIPGNLHRFGSESSLPGLFRSNSFSNLSQQSVKNRISWRQSNGNLSRAGPINTGVPRRGRPLRSFRRRGGGQRAVRGRFRGGRQGVGRVTLVTQRDWRPAVQAGQALPQLARRGGAARGRGRGGLSRNQQPKPVLTKEELDLQLDQYMAGTKAALDRELDNYMKNAMELE